MIDVWHSYGRRKSGTRAEEETFHLYMHEIFYRYRVHPDQARAFEEAYGPAGPWSKLFARHPGFVRTRLFRHKDVPGIYVTVDVWQSEGDYAAFKRAYATEYRRLNDQFALLKLQEDLLVP